MRKFSWTLIIASLLGATGLLASEDIRPTIIGGRYAQEGEFPEAVYITSGRSRCSASLIGPRALLTAAHCTTDDGSVEPVSQEKNAYIFTMKQVVYRATCTISPKYSSENHDVALCKINQDVDVKYASVVKRGEGPELEDKVTHIGYGCTQEGGGGGNDGRMKVGEAEVYELSNEPDSHWWRSRGDGLCFGDSGGPGYRYLKDAREEHHVVLGVNSRGNIKDINLLTDLATQESQDFMRRWSEENDAKICGLNKDCGDKDPDPDDCKWEKWWLDHYQAAARKWEEKYAQCRQQKFGLMELPYLED